LNHDTVSDADGESLYRVINARRDVRRHFRPDPVPDDVLLRVLAAAHAAPSVGLSQPWDFLVITDTDVRRRVAAHVERTRRAFAETLPSARAAQFNRIKIAAVLDTPLNVVVTSTQERGSAHILGRATQPATAAYSTCLAIENLWLAARAEHLGVGWVSFAEPDQLARLLQLPSHVEIVAYLCLGYVERFDPEPELALAGWALRRPLAWAVHRERWGERETSPFADACERVCDLDETAMDDAREHDRRLTKPPGSLGQLEECAVRLAGIAGTSPPPVPAPAAVAVFAADHGVVAEGVTPWPADVTAQMVASFCAGGAAINVIARQVGAEVVVVDVGVAATLEPAPGLLCRKVAAGSANLRHVPAMTPEQTRRALDVGAEVARELVAGGARCLITGDMGIGNTTPSAALISWFTKRTAAEITGRGTGIDDDMLAVKIAVIEDAIARTRRSTDPDDALAVLASLGGLEIAALSGFIIGGAAARVPIIVDGVISAAALLAAAEICPGAVAYTFAGHRSAEPGSTAVLDHLGLRPLLDLDLRLGEGTGACLALPLLQTAARLHGEMATFDQAGVTNKTSSSTGVDVVAHATSTLSS